MRAFIVAASPLARAGLKNILSVRGVEVVGSVPDIELVADQLADAEANIVLVDASGEQFETVLGSIRRLELASESAIIILADHPAPGWLAEAVQAGVGAVLSAEASPERGSVSARGLTSLVRQKREKRM